MMMFMTMNMEGILLIAKSLKVMVMMVTNEGMKVVMMMIMGMATKLDISIIIYFYIVYISSLRIN